MTALIARAASHAAAATLATLAVVSGAAAAPLPASAQPNAGGVGSVSASVNRSR